LETSTRKGNKTTITYDKGRLSKEEIERIVKDANTFRAEDEKQLQRKSAQHNLEQYCFFMMSTVENKNIIRKISESDKNTILYKCNEVIRWLERNQLAEKEEFEFQKRELNSICKPIMDKLYQGGEGLPGGKPGGFSSARNPRASGATGTGIGPNIDEVD
jgi:L1 cell adhesion molecule like protein